MKFSIGQPVLVIYMDMLPGIIIKFNHGFYTVLITTRSGVPYLYDGNENDFILQ